MSDYKKDMGLRIKSRRKKLLMTQEEIAEQLDISIKHFSEVERGIAGLSVENLIKLSGILGLSLDFIIKGESADSAELSLAEVPNDKKPIVSELINLAVKLSQD